MNDKRHSTVPELSTNDKHDALTIHALEISEELAYSTILFIEAGSHVPIYNENKLFPVTGVHVCMIMYKQLLYTDIYKRQKDTGL